MSPSHGAVCVSCRSGGDTLRFLSCGLLWILITRLQRYRTLLQASLLHSGPSFNPLIHSLIQITHEAIAKSSNVLFFSLCPLPACNCDPMGSISMQCHSNGTCQCRQGFVGYKCDKCELNYFHNRATHQCEECPVCYGLVQKQVSLKLFVCVCMRPAILAHQNLEFLDYIYSVFYPYLRIVTFLL